VESDDVGQNILCRARNRAAVQHGRGSADMVREHYWRVPDAERTRGNGSDSAGAA
jgi:hypothetical protein